MKKYIFTEDLKWVWSDAAWMSLGRVLQADKALVYSGV